MARSSADDEQLRRACQMAIDDGTVVMSIRTVKSGGIWGKSGKLGMRHMAKPRVLAISTKVKGKRTKAFLRVLKYTNGGDLEAAKMYKLKHLSKVEVSTDDPSGCTFMMGFDNLRSQSVAPPQWTMRNVDDRQATVLVSQIHYLFVPKQQGDLPEGMLPAGFTEDLNFTVERDLVSQAEEADMEALLGTYVMGIGEAEAFSERLKRELQALEAANVHAILENEPLIREVVLDFPCDRYYRGLRWLLLVFEDMDEWLGIFNVKLRHMREDIESIETGNNKLEMQSVNNKSLIEELDKLIEKLHIPAEYASCLTRGSFDEANMHENLEACEWLAIAIKALEAPNLDRCYAKLRSVREKRAELQMLETTFVQRASEFLRNYFVGVVDIMISDKNYFSQRGQLKRPDHADLRYKCRTYARLLQHLKSLDKNCLAPLRKAYCSSLNLLLRREAREFANELRASTKISKAPTQWLDFTGSNQSANSADTSNVSEAYSKMLTVFIPLLVDESSFFALFMCFEVPALQPGGLADGNQSAANDGSRTTDLQALNESLHDLLDGIQEDFYSVVDWAHKIDPLRCISMHGITERYISGQKADAAGYVRILLDDLENRISVLFGRFVDEACHQIERNDRNVRQVGVLPYIPRFATLATRMEQYIQGQSRDLVDQAYTKIVTIMFVTLDKISQADLKYADVLLLENYAAFQNSLYDLANVVPTLAKFYHQASESYDQSCTRYINTIIYYQFERLFQFARRIEDLLSVMTPEEVPFQIGVSKADLRKVVKSSLSGVDKSITAMYKKLQKNMTSEELLPSLWRSARLELHFLFLLPLNIPETCVIIYNIVDTRELVSGGGFSTDLKTVLVIEGRAALLNVKQQSFMHLLQIMFFFFVSPPVTAILDRRNIEAENDVHYMLWEILRARLVNVMGLWCDRLMNDNISDKLYYRIILCSVYHKLCRLVIKLEKGQNGHDSDKYKSALPSPLSTPHLLPRSCMNVRCLVPVPAQQKRIHTPLNRVYAIQALLSNAILLRTLVLLAMVEKTLE
ncbi:UNVERIFIED_CONTAM: Exocyst complex component SEC3A [Sesamum latifolium]|uniref:Exocyst complex component SEC3A n=1 Tax=Sesamum latifolium TaxID=2727402 RepID=A0AAW2WBJ0_9LAMI